jgi:hypothetical protein
MLLTNNDMLELCEISRQLELTIEETSTIETIRNCHLNRIELTDNQYDAFLMFLFSLKQSIKFKLQGE